MYLLRQLLTDDRWLPLRRTALIVHWLAIFTLTHMPIPPAAPQVGGLDKLVHLALYFPLGFLLPLCRVRGFQRWGVCFLGIALYGICDELLQIPVNRTASVMDWVADIVGEVLGLAAAARVMKVSDPLPPSPR